jgi:hypothetical protein
MGIKYNDSVKVSEDTWTLLGCDDYLEIRRVFALASFGLEMDEVMWLPVCWDGEFICNPRYDERVLWIGNSLERAKEMMKLQKKSGYNFDPSDCGMFVGLSKLENPSSL